MRVLGVDPGLRVTGYGVLGVPKKFSTHSNLELIEAGVIRTRSSQKISERLEKIYNGLDSAIKELKPDVVVIEKLYANYKHPVTAILMGHARGVVCLLSGIYGLPLVSLPSTHVKKAVTGQGHAGKFQVQRMVQHYLGLKNPPEPPDVADALAIAMAYLFSTKKR